MGVELPPAPAHLGRRVAGRAVPLDVAAHTCVQISLGLPCVVRGGPRAVRPDCRRRMKASPPGEYLGRAGERDAGTLMTAQAKRLLVMAARASGLVATGLHGVHRDEIVRMDAARPDAPIVAARAIPFLVAVRAEAAVVGGDLLVPFDPVGPVL